jgi:hypothetical protein
MNNAVELAVVVRVVLGLVAVAFRKTRQWDAENESSSRHVAIISSFFGWLFCFSLWLIAGQYAWPSELRLIFALLTITLIASEICLRTLRRVAK